MGIFIANCRRLRPADGRTDTFSISTIINKDTADIRRSKIINIAMIEVILQGAKR